MILENSINTSFWLKLSLVNLLLVAVMGVLMRYKICFEFPMLDQKNLQLAHSNFAFTGWVTQTLMVFMISYLKQHFPLLKMTAYLNMLRVNSIVAYGTILTFVLAGYSLSSISFLVLTILIGFWFAIQFILDLRGLRDISVNWFRAALFYMSLSTIGTFSLAYMMLDKHIDQHMYLASIYWYLHFQYNGWFFFACVGLFLNAVRSYIPDTNKLRLIFYLFFAGGIISYILSVLWLNLSIGFIVLAAMGAILQMWGWIKLVLLLKQPLSLLFKEKPAFFRFVFYVLGLAITVKLLLQLGSTIPMVSNLAFGYRPVVIAYLHLILLAIISVSLLLFIWLSGYLRYTKQTTLIMGVVITLIYINQVVLGIQGMTSFVNIVVANLNEYLLVIAILLVLSILRLVFHLRVKVS
ncbi:MAG: hypothetical protein V4651_03080 [Bacteroidota bacterium]